MKTVEFHCHFYSEAGWAHDVASWFVLVLPNHNSIAYSEIIDTHVSQSDSCFVFVSRPTLDLVQASLVPQWNFPKQEIE